MSYSEAIRITCKYCDSENIVKVSFQEQKQAEKRLQKRRRLETKRTGIPHQPKSKGGGRRPTPTIQIISPLRS